MKPSINLPILLFLLVLFQGCNTLYNSKVVNIEILEPGDVYFPPNKKKIAIKYNNLIEGFNPFFANYFDGEEIQTDSSLLNNDAAKVYLDLFTENIKKQQFFDDIIQLEPFDFTNIEIIDTISKNNLLENDSISKIEEQTLNKGVKNLTSIVTRYQPKLEDYTGIKIIHPELGLYSEEEIEEIADTTNADLLFSLDFFASIDLIQYATANAFGFESVEVFALWNIYDLETKNLQYSQWKIDSVRWTEDASTLRQLKLKLPPRRDAVLNAADIAGTQFAEFLVPHWTEVQRMYYSSGQVELKKTDDLVKENRWLDAAKIWKANINNPNKSIAAKCKFNMGLVCEMEGDFKAALDWVVQSFHTLGAKNNVHFNNCQQYISILSQRMLDVKKIDIQFHDPRL
ncbi:DUF6340 family protein [Draconibacterium sp.]|nr:DUF6340 family protein [Draconibacterium sp.]